MISNDQIPLFLTATDSYITCLWSLHHMYLSFLDMYILIVMVLSVFFKCRKCIHYTVPVLWVFIFPFKIYLLCCDDEMYELATVQNLCCMWRKRYWPYKILFWCIYNKLDLMWRLKDRENHTTMTSPPIHQIQRKWSVMRPKIYKTRKSF